MKGSSPCPVLLPALGNSDSCTRSVIEFCMIRVHYRPQGKVFRSVFRGVSAQGVSVQRVSVQGFSVEGGFSSGGLCPIGLCSGSLCPGNLCPGVSVRGGSLSRGGLCLGVWRSLSAGSL